jgi:phage gp29-like protein
VPTNIIAVLTVTDTDPPTAEIELRADGQVLTPRSTIPPEAILQLGDAVGQATGDPNAAPALRRLLQPVVDALESAVTQGAAQQARREAALTDWKAAVTAP